MTNVTQEDRLSIARLQNVAEVGSLPATGVRTIIDDIRRVLALLEAAPSRQEANGEVRAVLDRTHKLIAKFAESGFTDAEVGLELYENQGNIHRALSAQPLADAGG